MEKTTTHFPQLAYTLRFLFLKKNHAFRGCRDLAVIYITCCKLAWQTPIIGSFGTLLPVALSGNHVSVVLNLYRNDSGGKRRKINGAVSVTCKPLGTTE